MTSEAGLHLVFYPGEVNSESASELLQTFHLRFLLFSRIVRRPDLGIRFFREDFRNCHPR